ncbi:MAG: AAA family ATPase [Planctomycetes bacterium]|nr:AAA family ATPase [Planctomycetota bacterium]
MSFTHLRLESWRNFLTVDVDLQQRTFLVGPNAAGKSNLLDVFRFLRDVGDPQKGFQRAVQDRRGVSQIRSLHARRYPNVTIEVDVQLAPDSRWKYLLAFNQDNRGRPQIAREVVTKDDEVILKRPEEQDIQDKDRLTQTHLEQVNSNKQFRELAQFFSRVHYLHVVPQLIRDPDRSGGKTRDPYGGDFLEQLASTTEKTQKSRLKKIESALKIAVPQLRDLELKKDARGAPHLKALYKHWRPKAGLQSEVEFSDGTLRLIGLLWVFLDGTAPLLLEEPELSLHSAVVRQIPRMMSKLGRKTGRQILVSTHSAELLSDPGISPEEVLILEASENDTKVRRAVDVEEIKALVEGGLSIGEAVIPRTAPRDVQQLTLWD